MDHTLTPAQLAALQAEGRPIELLDVRRAAARRAQRGEIAGGRWLDPEQLFSWKDSLVPGERALVIYCAHGHEISQGVAATLRAMGHSVSHLDGGFSGWQAAALPVQALPAPSRWVTRERPKIDRIACPWLVLRFVDPQAEFLFVPPDQVLAVAEREAATPFDIPGVALSHVGERCSFDALIAYYRLADPALQRLATIVRGADTDRLDLAPACAGLLAIALGLSRLHAADDQACLRAGLPVYDALYAWCQQDGLERHQWGG